MRSFSVREFKTETAPDSCRVQEMHLSSQLVDDKGTTPTVIVEVSHVIFSSNWVVPKVLLAPKKVNSTTYKHCMDLVSVN